MERLLEELEKVMKDSYDSGVNHVLKIVQEQRLKPFNPEDLGFKIVYKDDREISFGYNNCSIFFDKLKDTYFIRYDKYPVYASIKNIKIFGIELFRGLGVIE